MIVTTQNREQYRAGLQAKIVETRACMVQAQQKELRALFDSSFLDSSARACIEVAREAGFDDLALEMEGDMEY